MNLLTLEHITKSYTEKILVKDADFSLNTGEKVGIIGINGTGKSTLLRLIAGLEEPDEGTRTIGNGLAVRYLPQTPEFAEDATVLEGVLAGNMPHGKDDYLESQAKSMLNTLEVFDFDQPVKELSGGQKKRVALANVLLSSADILILDEPTNHLDSAMADWLEEYLKKFKGALVMVTHDRYFLDSVTNRIVEIDKGKTYGYVGGYSKFLELKAEREAIAISTEKKRQNMLRIELEWMRRGARARSTKQKAHIQRYEALRDQKGPEFDAQVEMSSVKSRLGRTTVELLNISKGYGDRTLINDFSYIFLKNDRIGIIGPNGCGKSTLMKLIMGVEPIDSGEIVIGQTVKLGYFSQENEYMDHSQKVIDYIRDVAEFVPTAEGSVSAAKMLERFLFPSDLQYQVIGRLSGGERRRLYLLRVLMEAPNVLILDEPTNDLDIQTLMILEDYLDTFPGIVITVSHDRYFLDRVVRRIFAFEANATLTQYEGGYTDYQAAVNAKKAEPQEGWTEKPKEELKAASGANWKQDARHNPKKLKFTYKEQKDFETIEADIEALEEKIAEKEAEALKAARDFVKLNQIMEEKAGLEKTLEEKMDRWMYLEDLAARIEAGETV